MIFAELSQPTTFDLTDETLDGVVKLLAAEHKLNVVVDKNELQKEGVFTAAATITLKVRDISLSNALKLILDSLNLGICVEDDVLKITTKAKLSVSANRRSTRTYP
ncbi:MAG: hypothetical protein JWN70_229, partial [Planctomycetaceae bacterium]|nr:hypothetical protein [Planctomycetaceae bacterium]